MDVVDRNLAIVPITSITTAVDKSIYYAQMLANNDVITVHVYHLEMKMKNIPRKWKRHFPDVRLVILFWNIAVLYDQFHVLSIRLIVKQTIKTI